METQQQYVLAFVESKQNRSQQRPEGEIKRALSCASGEVARLCLALIHRLVREIDQLNLHRPLWRDQWFRLAVLN